MELDALRFEFWLDSCWQLSLEKFTSLHVNFGKDLLGWIFMQIKYNKDHFLKFSVRLSGLGVCSEGDEADFGYEHLPLMMAFHRPRKTKDKIILVLGFQVVNRFWLKVIANQKLTLN